MHGLQHRIVVVFMVVTVVCCAANARAGASSTVVARTHSGAPAPSMRSERSSAPPPRLFPSGAFTVSMAITRFASNPANDTSVNTTVAAVMAVNSTSKRAYLQETHARGALVSATWTDAAANTSTVQVSWTSLTKADGRSMCLETPLFKNQVQVVSDLTVFNECAGFAAFKGVTTWRGMSVRKYGLGPVALYTANDASNVALGLWDGKGGVYQFHAWQENRAAPPPPAACRRVATAVHTSRPQWWLDAASAAGVEAQDAGVSVQHGADVYWMFGDTFLSKTNPTCPWPGVSNTAMHVSAGSGGVVGTYYTGTQSDNGGCAWFLAPVSKQLWNSPHSRRLWPTGGGTINNSSSGAFVFLNVVDGVDPGCAVAMSDPSGPPAYKVAGATQAGGYTALPVSQPNPILTPRASDSGEFVYVIDYYVPEGFSDSNRYARLSRVPATSLAAPAAYEFWTGAFDVAASGGPGSEPAPVFAPQQAMAPSMSPPYVYNVNNPQSSVAWLPELSLYALATTDTFQDLYLRLSPWPHGPWSSRIPLYSHFGVPDRQGVTVYCAYWHPEVPTTPNATVLTFSRNGGGCGFPTPCNDWLLDVGFPLAT